jgi:hypothetical protein
MRVTGLLMSLFSATVALQGLAYDPAEDLATHEVVMEEATTRGKLVFLEDDQEDRRPVEGVRLELWDAAGKKKLYGTTTDDLGFFDLPDQPPGVYSIRLGRLRLRLRVYPRQPIKEGEAHAPKLLLIMIPAEVI